MRENALKALQSANDQEKYNLLFEVFRKTSHDRIQLQNFNRGFTKDRLESLAYQVKKMFGIKDLEIIETLNKGSEQTEEEEEQSLLNAETDEKILIITENSDVEPIRNEFPFLNDENCPEVLLIAVGRKITAFNKEKELNAKIIALKETNPESEELQELAEKAIHHFNENEKLYKELKHYGETGEILGEHELFAEYAFKKEVDAMSNKELIAYQNSSKKFFSTKNKELDKADELKSLEIQKAIDLRKIKLNMVNKKLGV